eukprot:gene15685-33137_t
MTPPNPKNRIPDGWWLRRFLDCSVATTVFTLVTSCVICYQHLRGGGTI